MLLSYLAQKLKEQTIMFDDGVTPIGKSTVRCVALARY